MISDRDEATEFRPKFGPDGLLPAIAVDHETGDILMLAYMNKEALTRTLETREVYYWSRSRQELWHKGATSGHTQDLVEMQIDCDQDTIILRVKQAGPACHTDRKSCFYRMVNEVDQSRENLNERFQLNFMSLE